MKKTIYLLAVSALMLTAGFQSCNNKGNAEMQKPSSDSTTEVKQETSVVSNEAKALNHQNMQDAFKGETTASAKYAEYSKKAQSEGYHEIALLFKAASTSEKIHANNHKAVLESEGQTVPEIKPEFTVNSTKENLQDAIKGEGYEISTMYPEFLKNADAVSNQLSLVSLNYAYKTEQKHKPLYEKALAAIENNSVKSLATVFYICPTCGNTYDGTAPKRCGISMTSSEKFIKITSL